MMRFDGGCDSDSDSGNDDCKTAQIALYYTINILFYMLLKPGFLQVSVTISQYVKMQSILQHCNIAST